jgi:hypothetical protein
MLRLCYATVTMTDLLSGLRAALADRYAIQEELGRGGMAIVFLAEDLKHHRKVAIKVLKPELAAVLGRDRFLREIEIAAHLTHPHILPLHDSGEADGFLYYVMPYVEGESLRDRLSREKQLPLEDALRIAREVADALSAAHSHGLVHRDVKPENILLEGGHAVISDFGIARAITEAGGDRLTGTGVAIGTPEYMSPEQATGERTLDGRSDLYSLGCVLYEMLAGEPPFTAEFAQAIVAKHAVEPAPGLRGMRDVPSGVERVVLRCLAKTPDLRYGSGAELQDSLAACQAELSARGLGLGFVFRRPAVVTAIVAVSVAMVTIVAWLWVQQSRAHQARTVALPEAERLVNQGRNYAAFRLLRQAEVYLSGDPVLQERLADLTVRVAVRTTPPGAQIRVRDFFDEPDTWDYLGVAPLDGVSVPFGTFVWKVSLDGHQTKQVLGFALNSRTLHFTLRPAGDAPEDMVHVSGGRFELFAGEVHLGDFWIDKYEVTNRQFKEFLDQGGYERSQYWTQPFVEDGVPVPWERARRLFVDRTGRPGPATWELGTFREGQDEYPVGGVSWYEAAAYCASVGKRLPTVYHWYHAADLGGMTELAPLGNFDADGPERVGHPLRLGVNGTYDMAGNVKEWSWNRANADRRYILGAGWSEPSYYFHDYDAQDPFERQVPYGFRCARYGDPLPAAVTGPVEAPFRDYRREHPVGDEVFTVYESLYDYDPIPLDARVESVQDFEHWRVERVSFAAAYGNERVPALLFLPKNRPPPYQTVVYFPGAGPFIGQLPPATAATVEGFWWQFLVRSGRAVLFPIYKGSYERSLGPITLPHIWRDVMIHASKDLRRAIDYLETRPDIEVDQLAYLGLSMGAGVGPIMTATEPRFKASVLLGGGLYFWRRPPESEPFNFLPRVKVPTLMINGRHDFYFQYETSQLPMFRWLGTSPEDKRHSVFESGHVPTERNEVIREILDWLDRYLGPVSRN